MDDRKTLELSGRKTTSVTSSTSTKQNYIRLSQNVGVLLSSFDHIALAYDRSIDWESRLSREIPFILDEVPDEMILRVLDVACGSGRHSVALASRGFDVTGFDSSEIMIAEANKLVSMQNVTANFFVANMMEFSEVIDGEYDLVLCLGNSLALLPTFEDITSVTDEVHSILKPNGRFIFQVLNFEEIMKTGFSMFPLKRGFTDSGEEVVFARHFDHSESSEESTLVLTTLLKTDTKWKARVTTQSVLRLDRDRMAHILKSSGFDKLEFYGGYNGAPFRKESDRSLVARVIK